MRTSIFIFLWILTYSGLIAQNRPQPLDRAAEYIKNAEQFYAQAQFESAIKEYQFAANLYRQERLADKYAVCYNGIGNCYVDLTRYEDAFSEFRRVLVHYDEQKRADSSFIIDSSQIADAYEGFARVFSQRNSKFDSALIWHNRALELRMKSYGEKHPKTALSYYFIGKCYRAFGNDSSYFYQNMPPATAELFFLQKGAEIQIATLGENHYQTANSYEAISDYYLDIKNDQPKAVEFQQKALSVREKLFKENHPAIANSYLQIAKYHRLIGDYENELLYLEKALSIHQKKLGDKHQNTALNYVLLANYHFKTGDTDKAKIFYDRALRIYLGLVGEQNYQLADVYIGLSKCAHAIDRYEDEFLYLQQALEVRRKTYGSKHYQSAQVLVEIGNFYLYKNKPDSSILYYQNAADIFSQQLGANHIFTAAASDHLAKVYAYKQDTEKEFFYLNESLLKKKNQQAAPSIIANQELADEFGGTSLAPEAQNADNNLFQSYLNLAYFYQRRQDYKLALSFVQSALATVSPSLKNKGAETKNNPSLLELSHNVDFLPAIHLKSEILFLLSLQNNNKKELDFAAQCYELTLNLIDTLRGNFTTDGAKELLIKRSIPVFEGAMNVYNAQYTSLKDVQYLQKAFSTLERSKAFVLMQAINSNKARGAGIIPADLLAKEERLRQNLAYYNDFKNRPNKNAADFDKSYFDTKQEYDLLIKKLEKDYPDYYKIKYSYKPLTIEEVQSQLVDNQTAVLEYFMGDSNLYVVYVDSRTAQLFKQPISFKQTSFLNLLRANLTDYEAIQNDPKQAFLQFTHLSAEVYDIFVSPFLKNMPEGIQKLTIVPDGLLNYLPFEVFLQQKTAKDAPISYKNLPFLIKKYEINYAYSMGLLAHNIAQGKKISHNGKCLAYAPTYDEKRSANVNLPGTAKELEAIKKVYSGTYIVGSEATKTHFLKNASSFGVVHLAMHGIVNFRNPSKSYLAFATVANDSLGLESNLYNYEIQNANLSSALVVLSACETGYGKVIRGEGVLSLARNFMAAGTPSVITTLWQVNDATSSTLMSLFYQNISSGYGKAAALRHAKLAFLDKTNEVSGHPAFWASFVTVGDPSPLHLGWHWTTWLLIIGLISAPFIISLLWLRNKNIQNKAQIAALAEQAKVEIEKEAADQQIQATNELIVNTIKQKIRRNISD